MVKSVGYKNMDEYLVGVHYPLNVSKPYHENITDLLEGTHKLNTKNSMMEIQRSLIEIITKIKISEEDMKQIYSDEMYSKSNNKIIKQETEKSAKCIIV